MKKSVRILGVVLAVLMLAGGAAGILSAMIG